MAQAIKTDRDHRCSLEFSLHVVDVMTSILRSGEEQKFIEIETTCKRPEFLGVQEANGLLA